MVGRCDFGSYRRADANGDSRAARVQYRLGRAAAVWRTLSSMNAISVLAYRLVATLAAVVALLVAFSGLATAIPLATFSYGVQHSHYLTVSFIQYLNPLIQFCVAVLLLHEPMRAQGYAAFMVIWVAIAVYSFGAIRAYRERLKPYAR